MLQGTDRIGRDTPARPRSGGTSLTALTGPLPDRRCAPTKQRPFPHRRLCCPPGSTSTTAASDAHPASHPLPGVTGYRTPRSGSTIRRPPGRGGPPQFPPPLSNVPRPIRRGVLHGCASRLFTASMAFTLISGARLSLLPPSRARPLTTPQASLHATDRQSLPLTGLSTLGSDPARFQTKPPACYRASWQLPGPDSHRQATTSLRTRRSTMAYVTVSPPALLGARKIGANSAGDPEVSGRRPDPDEPRATPRWLSPIPTK